MAETIDKILQELDQAEAEISTLKSKLENIEQAIEEARQEGYEEGEK